jgi:hypothetical protein
LRVAVRMQPHHTERLSGRAMPRAQYKRVKEYMADPRFTVRELRAVSLAGSGLLKWVLAMVNYFAVAKGVEPKRRKVADAELSLRAAQKELAKIKARPAPGPCHGTAPAHCSDSMLDVAAACMSHAANEAHASCVACWMASVAC